MLLKARSSFIFALCFQTVASGGRRTKRAALRPPWLRAAGLWPRFRAFFYIVRCSVSCAGRSHRRRRPATLHRVCRPSLAAARKRIVAVSAAPATVPPPAAAPSLRMPARCRRLVAPPSRPHFAPEVPPRGEFCARECAFGRKNRAVMLRYEIFFVPLRTRKVRDTDYKQVKLNVQWIH